MIGIFIALIVFFAWKLLDKTEGEMKDLLKYSFYGVIAIILLFEGFMFVETNRLISVTQYGNPLNFTHNATTSTLAYAPTTNDTALIMIYHDTEYGAMQLLSSAFIPLAVLIGLVLIIYLLSGWNKEQYGTK